MEIMERRETRCLSITNRNSYCKGKTEKIIKELKR